jgi:predicted Zn-dependent peptidase
MRIGRLAVTGIALVVLVALLTVPATAQVKDHTKIKYPALPEFKIAEPDVYILENGITVFLIEDRELPLITVRARIRTGSNFEPADKVGLADLMGTVQRTGGTSRMTGDEIDDYLAVRAASVETGVGGTSGFASMSCLTDAFDDTFAVFADVLRSPAFSEDKLEVAKVQSNAAIARRNDDVGGITSREFRRRIYGPDSPLARMEEYATIAAVTRDDLVAFHAKYYHPNNVYLGVVGDFETAKMKEKIAQTFGDWPEGPKFDPPEVPFRTEPEAGVYFIEKSDVTQANIRLGHLGIKISNPDYFAVQVLNEVLGGGFAGRLFNNVRSEKGLAYSVFGGIGSSFVYPGVFQTGLQTKSETMAEAVDALKVEINGIIDTPPSDDEMARAKESILNSFVFRYDSKSEILAQQMLYAYYGLPADFLEKYRESIEKVTKEDVTRVAKEHIHPDKLTLLVVGKSEDFDKPVSTFGEVTTLDITIPEPSDTTPDVVKTAATVAAGAEIVKAVARTMAGEGPASVKAIRSRGSITFTGPESGSVVKGEMLIVFPNRSRTVVNIPVGELAIVFDGDVGFRMAGEQVFDIAPAAVAEAQADLRRELVYILMHLGDPDFEAVAAGDEEIDGVPCRIVAIHYGDTESRLWVDEQGRILKQAYQGKHPRRRTPGQIELFYSDYRVVEGLQLPFVQLMKVDGEDFQKVALDRVEINPEVDPSLFEKP